MEIIQIADNRIFLVKNILDFDKKFLVFRDLRARGHSITLSNSDKFTFIDYKNKFLVSAFSERDSFDIDSILKLSKKTEKENCELWFSLIDDEGDITGELQSGSPAINAGVDIQALVESMGLPWADINGNPRDNTPTIGAYEYLDESQK